MCAKRKRSSSDDYDPFADGVSMKCGYCKSSWVENRRRDRPGGSADESCGSQQRV
jgi:hypothetical protein